MALCVLCLTLPFSAWAQPGKQPVSVEAPQTLTAKRGSTVTQTLRLKIDPGFHVNSNKPKDEFLIPLKLTWNEGPLTPQAIRYPQAEQVKVGTDMLDVYTGEVAITTEFKVSSTATPGLATMQGKLHYQACDNQSCKRPATLAIQIPLSIQ
jgi:DsbC/DsbD-like thiol-disulfide interchange protein